MISLVYGIKKKKSAQVKQDRMMAVRTWECGRKILIKGYKLSYKISQFWRPKAQHGDFNR